MEFTSLQVQRLEQYLKDELSTSADAIFQKVKLEKEEIELIYLASITDNTKIQTDLIKPFYEIADVKRFRIYTSSLNGYSNFTSNDATIELILRGHVVILTQSDVLIFQATKILNPDPLDNTVESTIQGPKKGFSESLETNISLIRHRYHQPSLIFEKLEKPLGKKTKMETFIAFDRNIASPKTVQKVKERVDKMNLDFVQSSGSVQRAIVGEHRKSLFPLLMITERADRVAYNLGLGKVILLIEGTPFALIIPATFFDFMRSMEDLYQLYWVSKFLITMRYIGLFISTILPAAYVGVTAYNPEVFRVQLALSIAGSRMSVPYPAYLEVFFMLFMMEMLVEASIRLPKNVGPTATTVGGLILGQAATDAGLVSNIMIIIVSAVAISNFVIPINEMGFAIRILKYILLVIGSMLGLIGLAAAFVALVFYLVHLDSFGEPYLKLFYNEEIKEKGN